MLFGSDLTAKLRAAWTSWQAPFIGDSHSDPDKASLTESSTTSEEDTQSNASHEVPAQTHEQDDTGGLRKALTDIQHILQESEDERRKLMHRLDGLNAGAVMEELMQEELKDDHLSAVGSREVQTDDSDLEMDYEEEIRDHQSQLGLLNQRVEANQQKMKDLERKKDMCIQRASLLRDCCFRIVGKRMLLLRLAEIHKASRSKTVVGDGGRDEACL